jgi:hypothetical protein
VGIVLIHWVFQNTVTLALGVESLRETYWVLCAYATFQPKYKYSHHPAATRGTHGEFVHTRHRCFDCWYTRQMEVRLVCDECDVQIVLYGQESLKTTWSRMWHLGHRKLPGIVVIHLVYILHHTERHVPVGTYAFQQIKPLSQHTSSFRHYLAQSDCLAADRLGQDTRLALTPSVTPNYEYVIMVCNRNCLKYCILRCFLYCNRQVHRLFDHSVQLNSPKVNENVQQLVPPFQWAFPSCISRFGAMYSHYGIEICCVAMNQ